ncbi:hypothetical protein H5410_059621 [Solanum commersonii]|uniref:Uncharacterized protein n=1 Tax=Solanum commersonii TaxID=4109 RepID=A0A9J5W392_SOLCO|nr:hypothetical protein H5410_059621 [Solanum commersonii]
MNIILCVKYVGPSGIFAQIKGPTLNRMKCEFQDYQHTFSTVRDYNFLVMSSGSLTFSMIQEILAHLMQEKETVDRDAIKGFQREVCDRPLEFCSSENNDNCSRRCI